MVHCALRASFAVFAAVFFFFIITISPVSAQELSKGTASDEPAAVQAGPPTDPYAAERTMTFQEEVPGTTPGTSSAGTVFRMVLTLALVAVAIYGLVYFIKRSSRRGGEMRDPFLKVLASARLGPNRNVHVVAAGSRAWLLGAADGGVNLICEIEDKDLLNAMFLEDSKRDADAAVPGRVLDFKSLLRRLGMPVQGGAPGAENIRKRRERLKGL